MSISSKFFGSVETSFDTFTGAVKGAASTIGKVNGIAGEQIDRLAKASHESCANADFYRAENREGIRYEISMEAKVRANAALDKLLAAKQAEEEMRAKYAAAGFDLDAIKAEILAK